MKALGLIETRGLLAAIESADTMLKSADVSIFDKTYVGGGLVSVAVTGDVGAVKAAVEAGVAAVKKLDSSLLVSEHVIPRPHEDLESIIGIENTTVSIEDSNINDTDDISNDINVIDKIDNYADSDVNKDIDKIDNYTDSDVNKDIDKIDNYTDSHVNKDIDKVDDYTDNDVNKDINNNKDTDLNNDTNINSENINEAFNYNDNTNVIENNLLQEVLKDENKTESSSIRLDIDLENLQKETVDKLVKDNGIEKAIEVLNKVKLIKLRKLARQYEDLEITDKTISKASKKLLITKIKAYYK